jgi:hypothetical protein
LASNRQQIVSNAVRASKPRTASGGVSAPKSAAKSYTTGLGKGQVAPNPGQLGQAQGLRSGPGAAVGAPPAPATATPTPWSSKYEQTVGGARKNYLDSSANFDLAELTAKQDYGIDPGFNDYLANPNARAALLEQTFQRKNKGTVNSSGLQLYSGSTSNRLNANRSNYGVARDELAKSYRDALGEITSGRTKAEQDLEGTEVDAGWDRVGEAEAAPLDPSTAPAKPAAKKPQANRKQQTKAAVANARPAPAPKKKGKK